MHAEKLIRKSQQIEFFIQMTHSVEQSMITANMPVNKFETRHKYLRNLKTLDSENMFKTSKRYQYPWYTPLMTQMIN